MAVFCPHCGSKYEVKSFLRSRTVKCRCGKTLDISMFQMVDDFLSFCESEEEKAKVNEIQKDAQQICRMILSEDFSLPDIEIAQEKLREKVSRLFPDKLETYQMIFEARFHRLWEQFRTDN